uniref:Uncharacterized protein n=1 Tax=Moniliophthora roreri TaxID=221103 RepID=A0A0W0EXV1_MONRR
MPRSRQPRPAKQTPYPKATKSAASSFGQTDTGQRPDLKSGIETFRRRTRNPKLTVKERYERIKHALSDRLWLLRECEAALECYQEERYADNLETPPFLEQEKIGALEQMLRESRRFSKWYPPRPTSIDRLPDSAAVNHLNACLARCPNLNGRLTDGDRELLVRDEDGITLDELSKQYKEEITACLEGVQKEHGIETRKLANWKVRDTRVKGVEYVEDKWDKWFIDDSVEWL